MARPVMLLATLVAGLSLLAAASAAPKPTGVQHFFFGPGPSTSCEMDVGVPKIGTNVYCQTYPHTESVLLHTDGSLTICHGIKCIGNPPDQVPTLVYGNWMTAGPFRCNSTHAGIKCFVVKTGKGFLISPTAIKRI
jgi:hypothetical protein